MPILRGLTGVSRFAAVAIIATGCGGSSFTPSTQTTPTVPVTGPAISVSGTVTSTQTGEPVPGAFINIGSSHFETDASGRFTVSVPSQTAGVATSVGKAGYVTHVVALDVSMPRIGARLDIIEDSAPFSATLYRELARDAYDTPPGNRLLRPWTIAPSFYIRTQQADTGQPIPPVIVTELETMFRNSVPELTGGRFSVATIETGTEARPDRNGWVNVFLQSVLPTPGAGGQSTVGGNQGTMWLQFDSANPKLNYGGTACSYATGAAEHEVVHTMGFWHVGVVPGIDKPFQSPDFCSGRNRPSVIRYHAAIMYARPVNNSYADVDPISFLSQTSAAGGLTVACLLGLSR